MRVALDAFHSHLRASNSRCINVIISMNMGRSGGVNMKLYVRKIQKLVNGSGIKHPQVNAVFCEGHPLKLTDDVETLIHEAKQWFATHGPDRSNGLSLMIPLGKVVCVQRHCITQGHPAALS